MAIWLVNQDGLGFRFIQRWQNAELDYILDAIEQVVLRVEEWKEDYVYSPLTNEYTCQLAFDAIDVHGWFELKQQVGV